MDELSALSISISVASLGIYFLFFFSNDDDDQDGGKLIKTFQKIKWIKNIRVSLKLYKL